MKKIFEKLRLSKKRRDDVKVYMRKRKMLLKGYVDARNARDFESMVYFANLVACEDALIEGMTLEV